MDEMDRYNAHLRWFSLWPQGEPDIEVVRLEGSAVTGGFDRWSDIDVEVLCRPGTAEAVYDRLLTAIRDDFEVHDIWELPAATWPDGRQCFVAFQPHPGHLEEPTLLLDLGVHDAGPGRLRVDPRRHGRPRTLRDPGRRSRSVHDDPAVTAAAVLEGLVQARARRVTGEWLVQRAVRRGDLVEATDLHLRFALTPLVRMLRSAHCPWRHDFGLRYLESDLGPELATRLQSLLPDGDREDQARECFAWQDRLLTEPALVAWPEPGGRVVAALATDAPRSLVWQALTGGSGLARWLGRLEGEPGPGATYVVWHDDRDRVELEVLEWEPEELLRVRWSATDTGPTDLLWRLHDDRVELEHTGLDDAPTYSTGWRQHLRFLDAHLAGRPLPWDMFWEGWEQRYAEHQRLLVAQGLRGL